MYKLLPAAEFRREAQLGRAAGAGVLASAVAVRGVDEKRRVATFVFSDGQVDRAGDRIDSAGWELGPYRRNPVALWSHDSRALPVGKTVSVRIEGPRLIGEIEFAPPDTFRFADQVFKMVRDGFLSACSVGFLPTQWAWSKDASRPLGMDFQKQALLEISITPVPCNAGALLIGRGPPPTPDKDRARARRERQLQLLRLANGP